MQNPVDLRLARHGVILLLLALLTGFVLGNFHNRDVGRAAHLTGLIGGFGMIALGLLWPKLNLGRFWSGTGAWVTAASLYLSWLGLVFKGGFGSGPTATNSVLLSPPLMWDRAGTAALTIGALLSLLSVLIVLIGLRKLAAPAATQGAASVTIASKRLV